MVYYQNPTDQLVYGYDPATQKSLIDRAVANGWTNVTGSWPPPPTDAELIAQCKSIAVDLLDQTEWTANIDVANPVNTPYLTNQAEFVAYRNIIRRYAVNPVTNPVWPVQPIAQWSSV